MSRYRRIYLDPRGRRVVSGFVVARTDHPAGPVNGPVVVQRFELDGGGALNATLPPGCYLLHAELTGSDGTQWSQQDYVTLEEQ